MLYSLRQWFRNADGLTDALVMMILHLLGVSKSDFRNGLVSSSFYIHIFRLVGELQHTYFGAFGVVATIHSVHSHNIGALLRYIRPCSLTSFM